MSDRFVRSVGAAVVAVGVWAGCSSAPPPPPRTAVRDRYSQRVADVLGFLGRDGSTSPSGAKVTKETAPGSKSADGQPNSDTPTQSSSQTGAKGDAAGTPASSPADPPTIGTTTKPQPESDTQPTASAPPPSPEHDGSTETTPIPTETTASPAPADAATPPTTEITPATDVVEPPVAADQASKGKPVAAAVSSKPNAGLADEPGRRLSWSSGPKPRPWRRPEHQPGPEDQRPTRS